MWDWVLLCGRKTVLVLVCLSCVVMEVGQYVVSGLTSAESNYVPIKGEALGVLWGLDKFNHLTLGCPNLHVSVDHKLLSGSSMQRESVTLTIQGF